MATKTKDSEPESEPEAKLGGIVTGSMSRLLLYRLSVIATHRGLQKADALDKYAGPLIEKEFNKCVVEMNRELGEAGA